MSDFAKLRRIHTYCALCIARCGPVAVIENGRFTRLEASRLMQELLLARR